MQKVTPGALCRIINPEVTGPNCGKKVIAVETVEVSLAKVPVWRCMPLERMFRPSGFGGWVPSKGRHGRVSEPNLEPIPPEELDKADKRDTLVPKDQDEESVKQVLFDWLNGR